MPPPAPCPFGVLFRLRNGSCYFMYNLTMKRSEIVALIHENYDQLTELGVSSLAVFGSVAREEATKTSDVDILVEFNGKATFDRFMDTKFFLEDLLGLRVDLVMPGAIKPRMKPYIMRGLVFVM